MHCILTKSSFSLISTILAKSPVPGYSDVPGNATLLKFTYEKKFGTIFSDLVKIGNQWHFDANGGNASRHDFGQIYIWKNFRPIIFQLGQNREWCKWVNYAELRLLANLHMKKIVTTFIGPSDNLGEKWLRSEEKSEIGQWEREIGRKRVGKVKVEKKRIERCR